MLAKRLTQDHRTASAPVEVWRLGRDNVRWRYRLPTIGQTTAGHRRAPPYSPRTGRGEGNSQDNDHAGGFPKKLAIYKRRVRRVCVDLTSPHASFVAILDDRDFFHCHEPLGDVFVYEGHQFVEIILSIDYFNYDWQIIGQTQNLG